MDHLGLSHHDYKLYLQTLLTPGHQRIYRMHVLRLSDSQHLRTLTTKFLDGQVVYDVTTKPSRMLDVNFLDEGHNLGFEPDDPSGAPIHRSRMVRVFDSRYVDALGDWIDCPVFTGPIYDFERDGANVSLTAHGMEEQAMGESWDTHHYPAKSKITDAIRDILAAAGDVNAVVPDMPNRLPHDLTIHPLQKLWPHVTHLAASLNRHCFYDGMARFQIRRFGQKPVYKFHNALTDIVSTKRTVDGFVNAIVVVGPKPKAKKRRIQAQAILKGNLSPTSLSRNGVPHYQAARVERDHIQTHKQAQEIADRILLERSTTRTDLSFPTLPLPMFEEQDMVAVTDDSFGTAHLRMRQWNLTLEGGDAGGSEGQPMTVGTIKRTKKAELRR